MPSSTNTRELFEIARLLIEEKANSDLFQGDNARSFARRMFETNSATYESAIRRIGFRDLGIVLDAGCGYGQWSFALAESNAQVFSIDASLERINFISKVLSRSSVESIVAFHGDLGKGVIDSETVNAVFSYGVVFCTPWRETLAEFYRVLRPGGNLYFNATSIDWFAYLWRTRHNECSDYRPREVVASALANSVLYERGERDWVGQVVMDPEETVQALSSLGFVEIEWGWEGSLGAGEFAGDFDSDLARGLFEVRCRKADASP